MIHTPGDIEERRNGEASWEGLGCFGQRHGEARAVGDQSPWELPTLDTLGCVWDAQSEGGRRASLIENRMASTQGAACMATGPHIPFATFNGVKNCARTYVSQ